MLDQASLEAAKTIVYAAMPPTPQYVWPLLRQAIGAEIWLKHENHTPTGAFKLRGGLVHLRAMKQRGETGGVISATRGNHGQSLAYAAAREGIRATIVVPFGNSTEKNAAMQAFGAELFEAGTDFDSARDAAIELAKRDGLVMVASFGESLVQGVATYAAELFAEAGELDAVYVPIGLGSGICGVVAVRDLLGYKTKVVGVVSDQANAYALSFAAGRIVATNSSATFADGVAVRNPSPEAFAIIAKGVDRIVTVTDEDIAHAMRLIYRCTHNLAEGAGAAAMAAVFKERNALEGRRVAAVLSGGNIDMPKFADVLAGRVPSP